MFLRKRLIPKAEERKIVDAIKQAELQTSGEIRVHIEQYCQDENPIARAIYIFDAIGMSKTVQRNGVLIYVALKSRRFAIIGDSGINNKIPANFWDDAKKNLQTKFAQNDITQGIIEAIEQTGQILKKEFPYLEGDINEQSDDISYGK